MEIWSEIRREVLTGVLSKRAAIAKYGIGWHCLAPVEPGISAGKV
jgi:hypothetical protein